VVVLIGIDAVAAWRVQEAKTRLSEVIERAHAEGPQTITRHGRERAVILSVQDYRSLIAHKPDFKAFLLGGPKVDGFAIERDRDTGRDVPL
jgi:prevent-host-death family protein